MTELYFEDINEGEVRELGSYRVSAREMISFAEQYDPQPIHIDESAAKDSIYGDVIASGWYTASICMNLLVEGFLRGATSWGAFGLDELRWGEPVHPDDVIEVKNTILSTRKSDSHDDRGYVKNKIVGCNQNGEEVITWTATNIFERREKGD